MWKHLMCGCLKRGHWFVRDGHELIYELKLVMNQAQYVVHELQFAQLHCL